MATQGPSPKHRVMVVGSGNWGSTIAKVLAENTAEHPDLFEPEVQMWVHNEMVTVPKSSPHSANGSAKFCHEPFPLHQLINQLHENVKYLPGVTLPHNVIANPDLRSAAHNADVLVFNLPHQFIRGACDQLRGSIVPNAIALSCVKGLDVCGSDIRPLSDLITELLGIYCGAVSGANIASEVAAQKFSETTIAFDRIAAERVMSEQKQQFSDHFRSSTADRPHFPPFDEKTVFTLFHRPYFHVNVITDVAGVCLAGALKNVIALAAGFVDGLGWGDNARAAVMRVGMVEIIKFASTFFDANERTFTLESCGIADVITSCLGGRNFRCASQSVREHKNISKVEAEMLNGQKLQGADTSYQVADFLRAQGKQAQFPFFMTVDAILHGTARPEQIPKLIGKTDLNHTPTLK